MRLLAICWTVGWVIAGSYMGAKKGRSLRRAVLESLLFGPLVFLFLLMKRTKAE
jgi:hypothetical protein